MANKLPALDVEGPPKAGLERWRLRIDGLVEKPRTFSMDELKALGQVEVTAPFVCVEGRDMWVRWTGVPLRRIIEEARPLPAACWLTFYAYSEYLDSLPMSDATDERTMLAYGFEGGGLPAENGGPLRLVVPFKLGYKSVKWLRRISFADEQETGYWEARGYQAEAGLSEETRMKYGIR